MYCQSCGANVAEGTAFCTHCGRPIVGYSLGQSTSAETSETGAASPMSGVTAPKGLQAGFWLRFVAAFIDGIVLLITMPLIMRNAGNRAFVIATILPHLLAFLLVLLVGRWLYWALMESSTWQATVGKRALGLFVTDLGGNRATFGKTSGRFFAGRGLGSIPYLGGLYYLIDCICAGVTDRKQAIHDMIAGCLVMRRS